MHVVVLECIINNDNVIQIKLIIHYNKYNNYTKIYEFLD